MSFTYFRPTLLAAGLGIATLVSFVAGAVLPARADDKPAATKPATGKPAAKPPHQVIVCYFHRTVRCPTCQKISAYIEESVKTGFPSQLEDGRVKFVMVDFQNEKNQRLTRAYNIDGPTMVLLDVKNGKVADWKTGTEVWNLVGQKQDFVDYVRAEVHAYLDAKPAESDKSKKPEKSEKSDKGK